jgi:exopolysaccharide biosynthesis polyprenyl glycosylphosphotransferase
MNTNGNLRKHWLLIASHFGLDSVIFYAALILGAYIRFGSNSDDVIWIHWFAFFLAALIYPCAIYIFGLYSSHSAGTGVFKRSLIAFFCVGVALAALVAATYLNSARPLGRGVTLMGGLIAWALSLVHQTFLLHLIRTSRERVAYIVTCAFDEAETRLFKSFGGSQLELVGLVEDKGYQVEGNCRVLGKASDLEEIVARERINKVLCTSRSLNDATLCRQFCQLRYAGVTVMPLISLCEEVDQYVPLELVTSEWLLIASGEPHQLYIKKVKRLFDLLVSLSLLLLLLPILLLGMLAVKISSPGPIFYRQTRTRRFGKGFQIVKLRTMQINAEKNGAEWATGHRDPRITWAGYFLRRFRIDEIPQLFSVLVGEMSFVGPRPERPEIIEKLVEQIPFYQERLMVQPGLTGWAQVNYPYGASVGDARRKLEYDLYYMKHMSLSLDLFILLDTVRIVLCGGVDDGRKEDTLRARAVQDWERMKPESAASISPKEFPAKDVVNSTSSVVPVNLLSA